MRASTLSLLSILSFSLAIPTSATMPEPPTPPKQPFSFHCKAELSEQHGNTNYVRALAEFSLNKKDFFQGSTYTGSAHITTTSEMWKADPTAESKDLPKLAEGHLITLYLREMQVGYRTNLMLRLTKKDKNQTLSAEGSSETDFSAKKINASVSFQQDDGNPDFLILSMDVACEKSAKSSEK